MRPGMRQRRNYESIEISACPYLQILYKSSGVVCVLVDGGADPEVAVITQDQAGPARQIVEVGLSPLHQGWRHLYQGTLRQLGGKQILLIFCVLKRLSHI